MFKNGQIMWFGQYHVTCGYDLVVMIAASQAVCPGSNPGARIPQFFIKEGGEIKHGNENSGKGRRQN